MKAHRSLFTYSSGEEKEIYVTYEQPAKDRLFYLVYRVYWYMWFKTPGLKYVAKRIDKLSYWWHARKCNDDCGYRYPIGHDYKDRSEKYRACTYWGWDTGMDLRIYNLDMKNNTKVRYPYEPQEARAQGKPRRSQVKRQNAARTDHGPEDPDG